MTWRFLQDTVQKKDKELKGIVSSLQRQQSRYAMQCKTMQERDATIHALRASLARKDAQLLGVSGEVQFHSNAAAYSRTQALTLEAFSETLLGTIESLTKRLQCAEEGRVSCDIEVLAKVEEFVSQLKHLEAVALACRHGRTEEPCSEVDAHDCRQAGYMSEEDMVLLEEGDENMCLHDDGKAPIQGPNEVKSAARVVLQDVQNLPSDTHEDPVGDQTTPWGRNQHYSPQTCSSSHDDQGSTRGQPHEQMEARMKELIQELEETKAKVTLMEQENASLTFDLSSKETDVKELSARIAELQQGV
jgi:hypothetical protein